MGCSRRILTSQFLLGDLFLLETTGIVSTSDLLLSVPSLFVVVDLWAFIQSQFRNVVGPSLI